MSTRKKNNRRRNLQKRKIMSLVMMSRNWKKDKLDYKKTRVIRLWQ
jgi:hypothetical protein